MAPSTLLVDARLVRLVLVLVIACVGCNKRINPEWCAQPGNSDPLCATIDPTDGSPQFDGPPGTQCFGTASFTICLDETRLPTTVLELAGNLDTGDSPTCTNGQCDLVIVRPTGGSWCVRTGTSINVATVVNVRGSCPLVLLATTGITISGRLDVSSEAVGRRGPSANSEDCNASSNGGQQASGGGGGGGGSFGTRGGDGGAGENGTGTPGTAGAPMGPVAELRGGCRAGRGGHGESADTGGTAGDGGGAVYVVAGTTITVTATGIINASGAGGGGGLRVKAGGGGGGSGGMIVLDAPSVVVDPVGTLVANGGGGGGGAGGVNGDGNPGDDPDPTKPQVSPSGGMGASSGGGDGASGAIGTDVGGSAGTTGDGGGGGGGGVGVIRVLRGAPPGGANVSPPATN